MYLILFVSILCLENLRNYGNQTESNLILYFQLVPGKTSYLAIVIRFRWLLHVLRDPSRIFLETRTCSIQFNGSPPK